MSHAKNNFSAALLVSTMMMGPAATTSWSNPVLSHKYTADPQPIVWNNRLYVYASNDDQSVNESDGYLIQAYTLVSTDDMANWVDHGEVFRVPRDWKINTSTTGARAYAPGAAVRNNMIYLYPCGAGGPVGVVTAPRPEGPFTDVRNGRELAGRGSWCRNCNVPWLFDPAAFVDTDGQGYLYYGGGGANAFRVMRLNNDMVSLRDSQAITVNAPRVFEASYMHKRGSTYYFSYVNDFTGGDATPNAAIVYMTGNSPVGPFTFRGPVLRNPAINGQNINRNNNNHHAPVEFQGKWYMFYHDRRVANANNAPSVNQRNISVDSLVYNADGTMKEVVVTNDGVRQIRNFDPFKRIQASTMNRQSGITTDSIRNEGVIVRSISNNDWIRLKGVDFAMGASEVSVRAASGSTGGSIEFRTGSATGTLIGTCNIAATGGWDTWRTFDCAINKSASAGVKDFVFLVFKGTGEPFRLGSYQFKGEATPTGPNEFGWWFHDTFEDDVHGWQGRGDASVATTTAQKVVGQSSLAVTGRTAEWHGASKDLPAAFVADTTYSFSALAMYTDGGATERIKLTLEYTADGETRWVGIDSVIATSGQWIQLANRNFKIPTGATGLRLIVESPSNTTIPLYMDEVIGAVAGTSIAAPAGVTTGGTTSVKPGANLPLRPQVAVRGKTLDISLSTNEPTRIRVITTEGKTVANHTASGSARISLANVPAGMLFVEVRDAAQHQVTSVLLK